MLIRYGSPAHLLTLFGAAAIPCLFYAMIKKKTASVQDTAVFFLAMLNLIQHFFKPFFWPHLRGTPFSYPETAYNVCAFLIIATPFALLLNRRIFRNFISFVGSVAGALPLLVPQWFIGQSIFQWEFFRAYFCHVLLLTTSLLPVLTRRVSFREKDAVSIGVVFFLMLGAILLNHLICIRAGLVEGADPANPWESIRTQNPFWLMHPSAAFPRLGAVLRVFSCGVTCGGLEYVPVLWYFFPVFPTVAFTAAALGRLDERTARQTFLKIRDENGKRFTPSKAQRSPVRRSSPCPSHT